MKTLATVLVDGGSILQIVQNVAPAYGGALYLKDAGTTLALAGADTQVIIRDNVAASGGGGLCLTGGADVLVNNSALLELKNNTATSLYGG